MYPLPKSKERQRVKICMHCFKKFLVRQAEEDKECYVRFAEASKDGIQKNLDMKIQLINETQQRLKEVNLEVSAKEVVRTECAIIRRRDETTE